MIKLSLALGYIHYALKRQADNRQRILLQGLTFLMEYYDDRIRSRIVAQMQEAEYNVAHVYHLLGLVHLAIPYYERCLTLSLGSLTSRHIDNFSTEAAMNLQGIWAVNDEDNAARYITEKWLVL